jgi:S1-C subfamily serine protease
MRLKIFVMMALLTSLPIFSTSGANADLSEDDLSGVVTIIANRNQGSGFFISNTELLTAAHVVGLEKTVNIPSFDGESEEVGTVSIINSQCDVALIKVPDTERATLSLNLGNVQVGQSVFAIGSPIGRPVLSAGKVESIDLLQVKTSVPVDSGSSGGPLMIANREVVGLVVRKNDLNNAIAIPIQRVNKCLDEARSNQPVAAGGIASIQTSGLTAISLLAIILSIVSLMISILTLTRLQTKRRPIVITLPNEQKDER